MKYEMKTCLPAYKIAYSICFVILLSLVRGISDICEIGITLDMYMAALAIVFCADTLQMEYTGKRWEVFDLYPMKARRKVMAERIAVQCLYLWLLSILGYVCFYWQRPGNSGEVSQILLFLLYLAAVMVSVLFWGVVTFVFSNFCGNSLKGMGISIVFWLFATSMAGQRVLGHYNVFAFVFRDTRDTGDVSWLLGKGIALLLAVFMAALPLSVRKKKCR